MFCVVVDLENLKNKVAKRYSKMLLQRLCMRFGSIFSSKLKFGRFSSTCSHPTQSHAIYALSSGFGKCGVSVIRISGRQTRDALLALSRRTVLPPQRKAVVLDLFHPVNQTQLDRGLVLWFQGNQTNENFP